MVFLFGPDGAGGVVDLFQGVFQGFEFWAENGVHLLYFGEFLFGEGFGNEGWWVESWDQVGQEFAHSYVDEPLGGRYFREVITFPNPFVVFCDIQRLDAEW